MRIYNPYRCVIITGIMLSLSIYACEAGYTTKKGLLINAETERSTDIAAHATIHEGEATMEEIREAKLAVLQFLRYVGTDLTDNFLETLPDPILEYDEVKGAFWEFRTQYGRFRVSRQNLRVIEFDRSDSIPGENIRPPKPEGYTEDEALEVVKALARNMIPNFDERNFVLETSHETESYTFWWDERPGGRLLVCPPITLWF